MAPRILLCLLHLVFISRLNAQTKWELTKDKNNIKVYTGKEGASKFKSIKVEAVVTGTVQKLTAILRDVNNNKNWVYNTKHSSLVKKNSINDIVYYEETELPWPVDNRDVVIRLRLENDSINKALKVVATAEKGAVAEKKGVVRVTHLSAIWNVRALPNNQIAISYILSIDPRGSIPAGVINMFMTKGPFETFNNLAQLLKK